MNWYKLHKFSWYKLHKFSLYKKAQIRDKFYNDDDMMEYINALLYEEMEGEDLDYYERLRIKEDITNKLNSFPPGYKLKKTINGWSVISPEGDIVSLNEKKLIHYIPGGKIRFDFMGIGI